MGVEDEWCRNTHPSTEQHPLKTHTRTHRGGDEAGHVRLVVEGLGGGVDDVGAQVGDAVDAPHHQHLRPADELDGVPQKHLEALRDGHLERRGARLELDDGLVDHAVEGWCRRVFFVSSVYVYVAQAPPTRSAYPSRGPNPPTDLPEEGGCGHGGAVLAL